MCSPKSSKQRCFLVQHSSKSYGDWAKFELDGGGGRKGRYPNSWLLCFGLFFLWLFGYGDTMRHTTHTEHRDHKKDLFCRYRNSGPSGSVITLCFPAPLVRRGSGGSTRPVS